MEYRSIRNLGAGNEKYNHRMEMAKDGKSLRMVSEGTVCELKGLEKGTLIAEDGDSKDFSLKTLYRRSWGKAFPGTEATAKRKPKASKPKIKPLTDAQKLRAKNKAEKLADKEARARRRELKASFRVKKGQLLSKYNHTRLMTEVNESKEAGNKYIQVYDKKIFVRSIISKGDVHLLSIETQSVTRTGRFFYNLATKNYVAYDAKIHKNGYGDKNIVWPELV